MDRAFLDFQVADLVVLGRQVGVSLHEGIPFLGKVVFRENGIHRALRLAGPAVDAFFGVDEHGQVVGSLLGFSLVDAFHGADIHA